MSTEYVAITLRGRYGGVALVDAEDAEWIRRFQWRQANTGYVVREVPSSGRRSLLHREILGLKRGDPRECDHISGDKLDNRRANLRIVSHAQNGQNLRSGWGRSIFRGVWWRKDTERWSAEVSIAGVRHRLGSFDTEEEAASAAASFRAEHMPFSQEAA